MTVRGLLAAAVAVVALFSVGCGGGRLFRTSSYSAPCCPPACDPCVTGYAAAAPGCACR